MECCWALWVVPWGVAVGSKRGRILEEPQTPQAQIEPHLLRDYDCLAATLGGTLSARISGLSKCIVGCTRSAVPDLLKVTQSVLVCMTCAPVSGLIGGSQLEAIWTLEDGNSPGNSIRRPQHSELI